VRQSSSHESTLIGGFGGSLLGFLLATSRVVERSGGQVGCLCTVIIEKDELKLNGGRWRRRWNKEKITKSGNEHEIENQKRNARKKDESEKRLARRSVTLKDNTLSSARYTRNKAKSSS
jgi:hypothetical protein